MIQEYNTATYIYRRPVCINMEKTHKQLKKTMPDDEFTPVLDNDTECHYCEVKLRPGDFFVYYAEHLIGDTHYLLFCRNCRRFGE